MEKKRNYFDNISDENFIENWKKFKTNEELANHYNISKKQLHSRIINKRPDLKKTLKLLGMKNYHFSKVKKKTINPNDIINLGKKHRFKKTLIARGLKISISLLNKIFYEDKKLNSHFNLLREALREEEINKAELQLNKLVGKGNINAIKLVISNEDNSKTNNQKQDNIQNLNLNIDFENNTNEAKEFLKNIENLKNENK